MSAETAFTTFVSLVDVVDETAQNAQEFASIWGDIDRELEEIGVHVTESYAILGAVDFLVIFEAEDPDQAFKASLILERHGFDTQTMEMTPTDRFAQLVDDV
ncbi:GYD domain-containing protein [Halobacteriales archaeon Cl-PHB]